MIGIIGGIGPLAGIDICKRIIENTYVDHSVDDIDQQHLPFLLASFPNKIVDRTKFLLGEITINPADAIAEIILELEKLGATKIGIGCNTAHAPKIFNKILELTKHRTNIEIINMVNETIKIIKSKASTIQKIGILCTSGSSKVGLYNNKLSEEGLKAVLLDDNKDIHDAIYNSKYGLKSTVNPHKKAIKQINSTIKQLKKQGSQGVILGCTEIAMIQEKFNFCGLIPYNPSTILARALINSTDPEKLSPILNI